MRPSKKEQVFSYLLVLLSICLGAAAYLAFGPPAFYARSESPEFCGSCHVLEMEYEAWFHSGAHKRIKCVDCHLPNDTLARHLAWKTVDGMKDALAFHTGRISYPIRLSKHGQAVVLDNCRRCHAELISRIHEDRQCWDCHRSLSHRRTGVIAVLTP
jgi:cytochrome c nitrite reductase small subunit